MSNFRDLNNLYCRNLNNEPVKIQDKTQNFEMGNMVLSISLDRMVND